MTGLLRSRFVRETLVPLLAIASLGAFLGLSIWQWDENIDIVSAALRVDTFAMYLNCLFAVAGIVAVLLAWRSDAPRESAHGEYYSMLLFSVGGMAVLVVGAEHGHAVPRLRAAVDPAVHPVRDGDAPGDVARVGAEVPGHRLGRVGDARVRARAALRRDGLDRLLAGWLARCRRTEDLATDSLLLAGVALVLVGLAFKASVAPFHQWTPDVYEGAPTAVTAFMAVATKAAAFGVLLRMMDVALLPVTEDWGPVLAALATISIVVGNVGALGQSSLKRLLAWS